MKLCLVQKTLSRRCRQALKHNLNHLKNNVKVVNIAVLVVLATGCSSVDILTKTENGASYEYQLGQFETIDIVDMAQDHCGKYGKKAELVNRYSGANRILNTLIFNCS